MGRRALPKKKPGVEYEHLVRHVRELPDDFLITQLFPNQGPLELEIGCGKGLYLLGAADSHPERNFIGNEIAVKYAYHAAYRLAQRGCQNARILAGDGLVLMRQHVPDAVVDALHVYFPDPWWKEKHRRRRVITSQFIDDAARILKPDGLFHFWTDVEEYFENTLEQFEAADSFAPARMVEPREAEHDMDYRTHFERRMRLNGHPVFRAEFAKRPSSS